jgi:hypothetical protein
MILVTCFVLNPAGSQNLNNETGKSINGISSLTPVFLKATWMIFKTC